MPEQGRFMKKIFADAILLMCGGNEFKLKSKNSKFKKVLSNGEED